MFVRRKWIWKVKSEKWKKQCKSNAKIIYKLFFFKVYWWWFCLELKLFICTHSRSSKAQMLPLNCHKLLTVSNHSPLIWCEAHCKHNQKLKIFNNSFDITNTIWLGLWIPFNQNDNTKKRGENRWICLCPFFLSQWRWCDQSCAEWYATKKLWRSVRLLANKHFFH